MTDQDLRTLLREHIDATEPPFTLDPAAVTAGHGNGRARRLLGVGAAGLLAATVAGIAVVNLPEDTAPDRDRTTQGIDPATAKALEEYDAGAMPELMDERIRAAVGTATELGARDFVAKDDQERPLREADWGAASSMTTRYGRESDHQLRVRLGHGRSYAEGSACQESTGTPTSFEYTCEATTLADGTVVETTVSAVYPDHMFEDDSWMALTPRQLASGKLPAWTTQMRPGSSREIDPGKVFFIRVAKAVHSETFVTTAQEAVQTTSYEEALELFALSERVLTEIVTDPVLVIPRPPAGGDEPDPQLYGGSDEANVSTAADLVLGLFVALEGVGRMPEHADEAFLADNGVELPEGARLEVYTMDGSGKSAEIDVCIEHDSGAWAVASTESRALRSDVAGGCPFTDRG